MAAGGELGYGAGAGTSMRGLAAIVAFALLVGGAVGVGAALLSDGGGGHDRGPSSATTPGAPGQSQSIPAIPGLRPIADPRRLRSKPRSHPVESSGTTSVSPTTKSESVAAPSTSQSTSAPTSSSSAGGGETSTHVTPPHSEGGTVHSESGGGA
ncbi:MAG: hypothetical protein WB709_08000 [Solirubrobacteraceae bacterium]